MCLNIKNIKLPICSVCHCCIPIFFVKDTTGSNMDDSESKSSSNGEEEEVILLMKNPDIIRHSISATNFTLASLGFHNDAYHTYSSPVGGTSNTKKTNNLPDQGKMIQGIRL